MISLTRALVIGIFFIFLSGRNAYSIPKQVEDICSRFNMSFCAGEAEKKSGDEVKEKPKVFTDAEKDVLVKLQEQQKMIKEKETQLEQREGQLKNLQEDIQSQISQLEKLQKEIERDIEAKKVQDKEQLEKAVAFYSKMDPKKAAESISKLNTKTAVQILMQIKDKTASQILANMNAEQAARIVEEITRKK